MKIKNPTPPKRPAHATDKTTKPAIAPPDNVEGANSAPIYFEYFSRLEGLKAETEIPLQANAGEQSFARYDPPYATDMQHLVLQVFVKSSLSQLLAVVTIAAVIPVQREL